MPSRFNSCLTFMSYLLWIREMGKDSLLAGLGGLYEITRRYNDSKMNREPVKHSGRLGTSEHDDRR